MQRSEPTSCVWTDDEDGIYHTTCGGMFVLLADTPRQNGMNYCCYCGRTLAETDGRETPNTEDEHEQPGDAR